MFRSKFFRSTALPLAMFGLVFGLVMSLATAAYAAHESNNRAELMGDGISGHSIVNYVAGMEGWTATAHVKGLMAGEYTFAVNLNGTNQTVVCTFSSDGMGGDGCSDQDAELPGFNTGVILDSDGNVVASGIFERRGGNREK